MDNSMDASQIVNGLAMLLSFYVGYKVAAKRNQTKVIPNTKSFSSTKETLGSQTNTQLLNSFSHNYKMVLVVRNDLKMGKGKIAAQCGHGAVDAYRKAMKNVPLTVKAWEYLGCAKIALKVESEKELMDIKRAADAKCLNNALIHDAGHTQIPSNTKTVVAIGPDTVEAIDEVTGHLKLL